LRRAEALAFVAFEYLEKNEIGMGNAAGPKAAPLLRLMPVAWPSGMSWRGAEKSRRLAHAKRFARY